MDSETMLPMFQIGDRVDGSYGLGTVRSIDNAGLIGVEHDIEQGGLHRLNGRIARCAGWWHCANELRLACDTVDTAAIADYYHAIVAFGERESACCSEEGQ